MIAWSSTQGRMFASVHASNASPTSVSRLVVALPATSTVASSSRSSSSTWSIVVASPRPKFGVVVHTASPTNNKPGRASWPSGPRWLR
jgi:hypothetical protein